MTCCALHSTDDEAAGLFYGSVLKALNHHRVPFLVAGTYAFERYTGFTRGTKDLDLFIVEEDWPHVVTALEGFGLRTELTFSHWLGKAEDGRHLVDFVFAGGNGLVRVDQDWFPNALHAEIHGEPVRVCPPEEIVWSKAFVMERERFDGADVLHIIRTMGERLDWTRLLWRFGPQWPVLLAHLVLFDFVYPDEPAAVPVWVRKELGGRYQAPPAQRAGVCRGTLLSRTQYLVDVTEWGYRDARRLPDGNMTDEQIAVWTRAAE